MKHLFRTQPKVQNSKPGENLSLSSIPEELLFPDPPGPVQYQESRPANIISPPVHKFPKLSPDSGLLESLFKGSSDHVSFLPQVSQVPLTCLTSPRCWRLATSTNLLVSWPDPQMC